MAAPTILLLLCASLYSLRPFEERLPGDATIARSIILSFHHLSVSIPCARGPRHSRFMKTQYRAHFLPFSGFQRRGTNIGLLLLLLCGDIELNPGPDDEVKCVCSSSEEFGQMLQCELCSHWLHCKCINISPSVAETYPYTCPFCIKNSITMLHSVQSEIRLLNDRLSRLENTSNDHDLGSVQEDLGSLSAKMKSISSLSTSFHSNASTSGNKSLGNITSKPASSLAPQSERKFNVVIFGLKEPPKGTAKAVRSAKDLESSTATLSLVDSNITDRSIRDCFRLGKYNESHTRPILVRLTRACEVQSILSQRYKLSQSPGISIKPDLSQEERAIESLLLKERKALIVSGTERKSIRIRGSTLFVNKVKYGVVRDLVFQRYHSPSDSVLSIPSQGTVAVSANTASTSNTDC